MTNTRNRAKKAYASHEIKQLTYWIIGQQKLPRLKKTHEFEFGKFITLSFARAPVDTAHARKLFDAWIEKLLGQPNKRYPLFFLYTIAHGENGRLHIHLLLYNRIAPISESNWPHGKVDCQDCKTIQEQINCIKYIKRNKNNETSKAQNITNIPVPKWFRLQFKKGKGKIRQPSNITPKSTLIPVQAGAPVGAGAGTPACPQTSTKTSLPLKFS